MYGVQRSSQVGGYPFTVNRARSYLEYGFGRRIEVVRSRSLSIRRKGGRRRDFLSTLSPPIFTTFKEEENPLPVVGLRNTFGCTRTEEFDTEGLLKGDIRWTILSYVGEET